MAVSWQMGWSRGSRAASLTVWWPGGCLEGGAQQGLCTGAPAPGLCSAEASGWPDFRLSAQGSQRLFWKTKADPARLLLTWPWKSCSIIPTVSSWKQVTELAHVQEKGPATTQGSEYPRGGVRASREQASTASLWVGQRERS